MPCLLLQIKIQRLCNISPNSTVYFLSIKGLPSVGLKDSRWKLEVSSFRASQLWSAWVTIWYTGTVKLLKAVKQYNPPVHPLHSVFQTAKLYLFIYLYSQIRYHSRVWGAVTCHWGHMYGFSQSYVTWAHTSGRSRHLFMLHSNVRVAGNCIKSYISWSLAAPESHTFYLHFCDVLTPKQKQKVPVIFSQKNSLKVWSYLV